MLPKSLIIKIKQSTKKNLLLHDKTINMISNIRVYVRKLYLPFLLTCSIENTKYKVRKLCHKVTEN